VQDNKNEIYNIEKNKLEDIFKDIDESKRVLVNGLIQDAAFLYAENYEIKERLNKTGMIKYHPDNPTLQKPLPAAKEYRQNLNSYAVVIKTLNGVLLKKEDDDDEDMDEFE